MANIGKSTRVMFTIVVDETEMEMIIDCLNGVDSAVSQTIREELIDTFEREYNKNA